MRKRPFEGEWVKLGDVLEKSFGGEWGEEDGDALTPVLRTSNFNPDGTLDYDSPALRCIAPKKIVEKSLVRGDVILEKSGGTPNRPVGIMAYFDNDETALCSNFNHVLRFKQDKANSLYMFYQLRWLREKGAFARYSRKTTGLQNLQMSKFVDLHLKCPSKQDQSSQAESLRKIQQLVRHQKLTLKRLDDLVKCRFVEMFGNPDLSQQCGTWKHVKEVCSVIGGATPKTGVPEYWGGELLWITPAEINGNTVYIYDTERKLTNSGANSASLTLMPTGTVLLSSRAPIGKVAIAGSEMFCNQGFKNLLCGPEILPRYLYELLSMNSNYLNSLGRGATFKELSKRTVEAITIPVPPLSLQQEFADFVAQVDKLRFARFDSFIAGGARGEKS